jgi:dolichol-phosphate mannosyltransferase
MDGSDLFDLIYSREFIKFALVGVSGIVVNEILLIILQSQGMYFLTADAIAIEVSILTNFVMNDLWTFRDTRTGHFTVRLVKFNLLMIAGLVVNLVIVDIGTIYFGMAPTIANLVGIGIAFLLRYTLSVKYAWMRTERIEEGQPAAGTIISRMMTAAVAARSIS